MDTAALLDRKDGKEYPLQSFPFTIGRHPKMSMPVDDPSVSRRHCAIWNVAGRHMLVDLASKNGTWRNRTPVLRTYLKDGDRISVGGRMLTYQVAARSRADGTPPQAAPFLAKDPAPAVRPIAPALRPLSMPAIRRRGRGRDRLATAAAIALPFLSVSLAWFLGRASAASSETPTAAQRAVARTETVMPGTSPWSPARVQEDASQHRTRADGAQARPATEEADPYKENLRRYLAGESNAQPSPATVETPVRGGVPAQVVPAFGTRRSPERDAEGDARLYTSLAARAEVMARSGRLDAALEIVDRLHGELPRQYRMTIDDLERRVRDMAQGR